MIRAIFRTYREAYEGLPREIWLLSIVLFINRCGTMVLPFLTLYLNFERGYTTEAAGGLIAIYGVGSIFGSFLGGWSASRFGAIRTQITSLILSGPAFLVLLIANDWWSLALTLFFVSVIADAVRPASATATADHCPRHLHKKAFGLNRLSVNLGMSLGPAIGGFIYEFDIRWLFIIDAITCFSAALVLIAFFPKKKRLKAEETNKEGKAAEAEGPPPWKDLQFLTFLGLLGLFAMVFFQLLSTYPLFLSEHYRFSASTIGLILAVNTIVIVAIEMVLLHWLRSYPDLKAVGIGALFVCLGFGLLPMGYSVAFCIFTVLLWTIGEMLSMPMSMAYVSRRASLKYRGMYLGMYTMTYAAAFVVAPLVGTKLYSMEVTLPWAVILASGVPLSLLFLLLSRWDKKTEAASQNAVSLASNSAAKPKSSKLDPVAHDTSV